MENYSSHVNPSHEIIRIALGSSLERALTRDSDFDNSSKLLNIFNRRR